ncbi:hypothetical protein IWQ60_002932 [Tieghemiomyces parasiticus]|uniref:C3H1-type domain-containing protein n=1 Tax=Tieghemiomyces parasiticus TaxID=78921 RepID=A0A9W8AB78_9FUNG|nr:hypothetical protein IWQ60_002932 [Tieghemiomyces parasiticus]
MARSPPTRAPFDYDRPTIHARPAAAAAADDDFSALLNQYQKQEKKVLKREPAHRPDPKSVGGSAGAIQKKAKKQAKRNKRRKLQREEMLANAGAGPSATMPKTAAAESTAAPTTGQDAPLASLLPGLTSDLALLAALTNSLAGSGAVPPGSLPAAPTAPINLSSTVLSDSPAAPPAASTPTPVQTSAPVDPRLRLQQAPAPSPRPTPPSGPLNRAPPHPAPAPSKLSTVLCRYAKTNSCGKGNLCPFSHDLKLETCRFFAERGYCRQGDQCPYSHVRP